MSWPALATDDLAADLAYCQGLVEARHLELLVLDQTRPDVGLPVVKVIVPGLRHFWPRFAPGRLYDVPVALGWRPSKTEEHNLNPVPSSSEEATLVRKEPHMSKSKPARSANATSTRVRLTVRLRSGVEAEVVPHGVMLRHPWGAVSVGVRPEVSATLVALTAGELDTVAVAELVAGGRPIGDFQVVAGLAQLDLIFNRLPHLVTRGVSDGTSTVVTVEPISDRAPGLKTGSLPAGVLQSLDRVAYLRRRPEVAGLCLESPLALHRAQLGLSLVPFIARLAAAPVAIDEVADERELAAIRLLAAAGLIHTGRGEVVEDERLATWNFHDLVFHAHSRPGRSDNPFGAHFFHRDRFPALPAVPPAGTGLAVDLPSPQFAQVVAGERSLTEVIESRKSRSEEPRLNSSHRH